MGIKKQAMGKIKMEPKGLHPTFLVILQAIFL